MRRLPLISCRDALDACGDDVDMRRHADVSAARSIMTGGRGIGILFVFFRERYPRLRLRLRTRRSSPRRSRRPPPRPARRAGLSFVRAWRGALVARTAAHADTLRRLAGASSQRLVTTGHDGVHAVLPKLVRFAGCSTPAVRPLHSRGLGARRPLAPSPIDPAQQQHAVPEGGPHVAQAAFRVPAVQLRAGCGDARRVPA